MSCEEFQKYLDQCPNPKGKDTWTYLAKLCEQAERFDEMVKACKKIIDCDANLTEEERNLVSVAYKNVVGSRRSAWRVVTSIAQKQEDTDKKGPMAREYSQRIKEELDDWCNEVIEMLDKQLLPPLLESDKGEKDTDSKVFFLKMKGDYLRYGVEVANDTEKKSKAVKSEEAYQEALIFAEKMPSTHPIRLGLALNFSVFYYEIMNDHEKACKMAKEAFDNAISELDDLSEDSYKDSTLIMQLLRDNLTLWTSEIEPEQQEHQ